MCRGALPPAACYPLDDPPQRLQRSRSRANTSHDSAFGRCWTARLALEWGVGGIWACARRRARSAMEALINLRQERFVSQPTARSGASPTPAGALPPAGPIKRPACSTRSRGPVPRSLNHWMLTHRLFTFGRPARRFSCCELPFLPISLPSPPSRRRASLFSCQTYSRDLVLRSLDTQAPRTRSLPSAFATFLSHHHLARCFAASRRNVPPRKPRLTAGRPRDDSQLRLKPWKLTISHSGTIATIF